MEEKAYKFNGQEQQKKVVENGLKYYQDPETKRKHYTIELENRELLHITSDQEFLCRIIIAEWANYFYKDAYRFHMDMEISITNQEVKISTRIKQKKKDYQISLEHFENIQNRLEIYRYIKEWCRVENLYQPTINALVTPGDMYDVGEMAFEAELLNPNYWVIITMNGEFLSTHILEKTSFQKNQEYAMDQRPVDKQRHPNIWKYLKMNKYYIKMNKTDNLLFQVQLILKENNEIVEETVGDRLSIALMELEILLNNRKSRKIVPWKGNRENE